jgi:transposase
VLARQVLDLGRKVQDLERENAELRARLSQNSGNSHRPPSTDNAETRKERREREKKSRKPSGRKAGAQEGHKGVRREELPPERVARREECVPTRCEGCDADLTGREKSGPTVRQVVEIEGTVSRVTEYLVFEIVCACGRVTKGKVPYDAAFSMGPRLMALVALLVGQYHLSRDQVVELLETMYGVHFAKGTIQAMVERVSDALAQPVAELAAELPQAPEVHIDETGWPVKGKLNWLWTAATALFVLFSVEPRRNKDVLKRWFSKGYNGTVHSDRWGPYRFFATILRQICWSHLQRDLQGIADAGTAGREQALQVLAEARQMFHLWHSFKAGEISRAELQALTSTFRTSFRAFCEAGAAQTVSKKWGAFGRGLIQLWDAVFRFLDVEGVEPTNNYAEQVLRLAVIWRRVCQGTRSENGSLFASRILTAVQTCRRQKRNALDYLHKVVSAWLNDTTPPSLLPQPATGSG